MNNIDFFIRQTAKLTLTAESIVEAIIKDQWKYANRAASNLQEVEVASIGSYYPSPKKVYHRHYQLSKRIEHASTHYSERPEYYQKVIDDAQRDLDNLKSTKYYDKTIGYLEKQKAHSSGGDQSVDIQQGGGGSSSREIEDLQGL